MNGNFTRRPTITERNFSLLEFDRHQIVTEQRNEENQISGFQQMSIAATQGNVNMSKTCREIVCIQNQKTISTKAKLEKIDNLLNNSQKEFLGYFFDYPSPCHITMFRYVYLEAFDGNLDSFINIDAQEDRFDWTVLPELCNQLVKAIDWLHRTNITYDGNLHPRNIFIIKRPNVDGSGNVLRLVVPQEQNPFSKSGLLYSSVWSGAHLDSAIQKDFASMAILVYFIQSLGNHPFQIKTPNSLMYYEDLSKGMKTNNINLDALEKQCFCKGKKDPVSPCDEPPCKYRCWVNSLAQNWVNSILDQLFIKQQVSCGLKGHPFFWEAGKILHFLQTSSSFLFGGTSTPPKPCLNGLIEEKIMNDLEIMYPNIIKFIHENTHRSDPVEISSFGTLIKQIRNKSCHWYEAKSKYWEEAQKELEKIVFVNGGHRKMSVFPEKYCLFWMIYFPELLLDAWDKLKGYNLQF